jgi:hypothetical protein
MEEKVMQRRLQQKRTFISPRSALGTLLRASLLLNLLASSSAFAQGVKATFSPAIAASAAPEQARFLAPGEIVQMRLEVFDAGGARLYDSEFKAGNLLDWNWQDQQGQRLADGAYRCLLTAKDVGGRESQRQGLLLVQAGEPA